MSSLSDAFDWAMLANENTDVLEVAEEHYLTIKEGRRVEVMLKC
jgi:hypothetical protein